MAKPRSSDGPARSSTPTPHQRSKQPSTRPRRRRVLASSSHCPYSPGPSSGLLSLLAALAASSSVASGSPAPPPFLCPSLTSHTAAVENNEPGVTPFNPDPSTPDSTYQLAGVPRHVPDKYERGDDGHWRRVEVYTLYGSTVCPNCREPTDTMTPVDDQIQTPDSSASDVPSSTPSYDIRDSLPPGWKPTAKTTASRTTLILALSLVLAFIICFFIIGCLFWRKGRHRKFRPNDVEMKARRRRRSSAADDDRESTIEKEVRVKQKIWARATARWKANARYSARQRKGKRTALTTRTTTHLQNSSTSLNTTQGRLASPSSSSLSLPLSRRSSIESFYSNTSPDNTTPIGTPSPKDTVSQDTDPPVSPPHPPPNSPPAYHQPTTSRLSEEDHANIDSEQPDLSSSLHPWLTRSSTHSTFESTTSAHDSNLRSLSLRIGHVATDDKTILARLADLASSPPVDGPDPSQASSTAQVSVPIWHDEELKDFGDSCHSDISGISAMNVPSWPPSPVSLFPPPPSKGKMAAPTFYDYPYTFEDMTLEPDLGPSAPPFEEEPSAPPISGIDLAPSAPPLEWDSHRSEPYAYTPTHSWGGSQAPSVNMASENSRVMREHGEADQHTEIDMTPMHQSGHAFIDTFSPPIVQGPVASDGTPPCYHP